MTKSNLWVADPRQVTLSCLSKEKSPKEMTPRSRRLLPALLAGIGARLTRRAHTTRLGLDQESRENPDSGCDARRRLRGFENLLLHRKMLVIMMRRIYVLIQVRPHYL